LSAEHLAEARCVHCNSINVIFYDGLCCLFLRDASHLDAFSVYRLQRSLSACPIKATDVPEAADFRSSRTKKSFHSDNCTP